MQKTDSVVRLMELKSSLKQYPDDFLRAIDAGLERFPKDRPQSIKSWRKLLDPALRDMNHGSHESVLIREPAPVSDGHPPAQERGGAQAVPPSLPVPQQTAAHPQRVKDPLQSAGLFLVAVILLLGAVMLIQKCSA